MYLKKDQTILPLKITVKTPLTVLRGFIFIIIVNQAVCLTKSK